MWNILAHAGEGINGGSDDHRMNGMGWSNNGGFTMLWMFVGALIVIVGVIYLLVYFAKKTDRSNEDDPMRIAKARYAKGEINKKQFDEIKKDINSNE